MNHRYIYYTAEVFNPLHKKGRKSSNYETCAYNTVHGYEANLTFTAFQLTCQQLKIIKFGLIYMYAFLNKLNYNFN